MSKEIQERIKAWEEKHGKRIEDLNAEETVEACMEVMCLTRSEAEEYLSATVKRFYKENGHFRLQPENDNFEPIIVDEVALLGKVISLVRYFD